MLQLNPGEKILVATGRHRFILYEKIGRLVALFALLLLVLIFVISSLPEDSPLRNLAILALLLTALCLWVYAFILWLDYYLDKWIITTERVIDSELLGLFQYQFSEFKLSRIQDISVDVHGVIPTMFDYGDIHIQTAGAARQFVFQQVPKPRMVKKILLDAYDAYMVEHLTHMHETKQTGL